LAVALVGGAILYAKQHGQVGRLFTLLAEIKADPTNAIALIDAAAHDIAKAPLIVKTPAGVVPVPPAPAVLAPTYADGWDLARDCGVRGVKQAVTLDGKVIFSGEAPALAYYTIPGGVSNEPKKAA
jgi:hypothetical protein